MTNRFEKELSNLINEYGLYYKCPSDSTEIHNIIMDLFKSKCEGKRVALWGAGRKNTENSHAAVILKKYTTYIQGMYCLIDSLPELWGTTFMGYPIISPEKINDEKIDIVIIASKVQSDSIISDLKKYAPKCEYIDIYGELKKRGIVVYHKFFEESNIYTTLYQLRIKYEYEKTCENLWTLISAYLSIQDFYFARKYAELYIKEKFINYEKIEQFFSKLTLLEQKIKDINKNKKDDVVIFFVDSLRAMDVFHKEKDKYIADMFARYLDKSVVFTNAKSTGVTTYESMISVVKQKYPYEQNVYKNNILAEFDEFKLVTLADKLHYKINFYVSEGYPIIHENEKVEFVKQIYLSSKMWKLATDMASTNDKTFNFVYVPYELHFPLICGWHEKEPVVSGFVDVGIRDTKDFVPRQLEECKKYVDSIFDYYYDWFSEDILMSVFADHSQVIYDDREQKPYFMYYNDLERCVNVTYFVKGFGLKKQWNEQLVSLYDFTDIMSYLLENHKLYIPDRQIACYQYYKIHYKKLRDYAEKYGLEDYIDGMQCFVSKAMLYMITATGKEEAYRLGEKENIIQTECAQKFKRVVEQEFNLEFLDFEK